jgi:hypothetical protein
MAVLVAGCSSSPASNAPVPAPAQVDFDPNGPRVVLSGSDGIAKVWDVGSGERLAVLAGAPGGLEDLAFSPDGSRVATASVDRLVRLFDAATGAASSSRLRADAPTGGAAWRRLGRSGCAPRSDGFPRVFFQRNREVTPHVMTPSLAKEGSVSRWRGQRGVPVCRSFPSEGSRFDHLEHVPDRVARRRACPRVPASPKMHPSRTREESRSRHYRQHSMAPICRAFVQALWRTRTADPSLPWNFSGNRWQPTATVFACFSRFRARPICHRFAGACDRSAP